MLDHLKEHRTWLPDALDYIASNLPDAGHHTFNELYLPPCVGVFNLAGQSGLDEFQAACKRTPATLTSSLRESESVDKSCERIGGTAKKLGMVLSNGTAYIGVSDDFYKGDIPTANRNTPPNYPQSNSVKGSGKKKGWKAKQNAIIAKGVASVESSTDLGGKYDADQDESRERSQAQEVPGLVGKVSCQQERECG